MAAAADDDHASHVVETVLGLGYTGTDEWPAAATPTHIRRPCQETGHCTEHVRKPP